jgi:SAM-dependent methyltransferase
MKVECRLCKKKLRDPQIIADHVFGGKPGQVFYHCLYCDVVFLYPPLTPSEEHQFYLKEFEQFMEKRAGHTYDWSGPEGHVRSNHENYLRRLPFFSDYLLPGKRVLELGCSSGFMLYPLKGMGMDVMGIEPSGLFSNYVRSKSVSVFPSIESMKLNQNTAKEFDLVLHFFLLEHVNEPIKFLKEAFDLLKEGGVMVFEVPSRSDPLISIYDVPAFHKFYWSVAHNWYFNRKSLEFVLGKVTSNFEIIPEQRYDLSNHMTWALKGKPGGSKRYSKYFTKELEEAYLRSMKLTGNCDTFFVKIFKKEVEQNP